MAIDVAPSNVVLTIPRNIFSCRFKSQMDAHTLFFTQRSVNDNENLVVKELSIQHLDWDHVSALFRRINAALETDEAHRMSQLAAVLRMAHANQKYWWRKFISLQSVFRTDQALSTHNSLIDHHEVSGFPDIAKKSYPAENKAVFPVNR